MPNQKAGITYIRRTYNYSSATDCSNIPFTKKGNTIIFEYSFPATEWCIPHNLNTYPSITITDTSNNKVIAEVEYVDYFTAKATFTKAFSGKAIVNS